MVKEVKKEKKEKNTIAQTKVLTAEGKRRQMLREQKLVKSKAR